MFYIEVYFQSALISSYKIERDTYMIGRSETADIQLNNQGVSNIHAVLQLKGDQLYISDLNSTNSTTLNSQKITGDQVLQLGDTLIISKYVLKVTDWAANISNEPSSKNVSVKENDHTMVAHPSDNYRSQKGSINSFLLVSGDKKKLKKLLLIKRKYRIGASKENDIQLNLSSWNFFTPRYIADIMRVGEAFYIVPLNKSLVTVNGQLLKNGQRLNDNDNIKIKKLTLRFFNEGSNN